MDKFFQDTRQSGEWLSIFTCQVRKQLAKNIERVCERDKKNPTRVASGFVFLLAKPEFYSHLASWRVLISTPGYGLTLSVMN
jgi:hypothetical protein